MTTKPATTITMQLDDFVQLCGLASLAGLTQEQKAITHQRIREIARRCTASEDVSVIAELDRSKR